ncbi:MAG TPA: hypothetical protein VHG08_05045 [Longimicrobium sp.]|nr:hypothetical protein [Longimicrobium sp.]
MAFRISLLAVLASTSLALAGRSAAQEWERPECTVHDQATLEGRNCAFLRAVRRMGRDTLAAFLPRTGVLTYVTTTHDGSGHVVGTWRFPVAALSGLEWGHPLFCVFHIHVEGQPIGTLSHQLLHRGTLWRRVERTLRFVPADAPDDSPLYVEWRRENGQWVVSVIGDESFTGDAPLPAWCC